VLLGIAGKLGRGLERAAVLLGYTQERVLGMPAFWIVQLHPADRDGFTNELERAVAERAPQVEQEYRFLFQDGTTGCTA
jgi:PAS domain-containing protein